MKSWAPVLQGREGPKYLAIADAIAADVAAGRLAPGDRLPPQRDLAGRLTARLHHRRARLRRGWKARSCRIRRRSRHVRSAARSVRGDSGPQRSRADFTMNMPPEPDDPELLQRMRAGFASVAADLNSLLRYQGFGGSPMDRDAAASWLGRRALVPSQERIFLAPGAHGAMVGIFSLLARAGDSVLCEAITYPGVRAICAQLGLQLIGVEMDGDGVIPEALEEAVRRHAPKAIYLNPTLQNPKTITIPEPDAPPSARSHAVSKSRSSRTTPMGSSHAWPPAPRSDRARRLLAHCGPRQVHRGWPPSGLRRRAGSPAAWSFNSAMRAVCVMASPISAAVATRWINDGTADTILQFIRSESIARERIAAKAMEPGSYLSDPLSFNIWLPMRNGWTRSVFVGQARTSGLGVVPSDAFAANGAPPEAVRVGLGGPLPALRSSADWRSCRISSKGSLSPSRHSSAFGQG